MIAQRVGDSQPIVEYQGQQMALGYFASLLENPQIEFIALFALVASVAAVLRTRRSRP